jgi:nucleoside-diphosphate-sugar epimerase
MDKASADDKGCKKRTETMKKVFLTGITGLLGQYAARELLNEGFIVTGLVRNPSSYNGLQHPNLTLVQGDLFDDLTDTLSLSDIVVHAAAETRQNLLYFSDYERVNFKATRLLYLTARKCGLECFVFISTANTMGYGNTSHPVAECEPIRPPFNKSMYALSKYKAEQYLLQQDKQMKVIILNPTFILGAGEKKSGSGRIIWYGLNKRLVIHPPGGKNFVHASDVAKAICKSFHCGQSHNQYLIAGENLKYRDFFALLKRVNNQKTMLIQLPAVLMIMIGFAGELLRMAGVRTELGWCNMRILCVTNCYINNKSVVELGMAYQPVAAAIQDYLTLRTKPQPHNSNQA